MPSKTITMKLAVLTPKEIEDIVRRVILEMKVAPLVQKEIDKIVEKQKKRKPGFRTTLRKERKK